MSGFQFEVFVQHRGADQHRSDSGGPHGGQRGPRGPRITSEQRSELTLFIYYFPKELIKAEVRVQLPHRRHNRGPFSTPVNNELSRGCAQTQRMLGLLCHVFVFMSE